MTDNSWFGVSQELVAAKIAQDVAVVTPDDKSILMDAFCGVGGNTIAFALSGRWKRVYAIEKDPATLECARRNAEIYGVRDKITWFLGDCFELLGTGEEAVSGLRELVAEYGIIFGSPPWGGNNILDHYMKALTANDIQDQAISWTRSLTSIRCSHTRLSISSMISPVSPSILYFTYPGPAISVRSLNVLKRERKARLFITVQKQIAGRCVHTWGTLQNCHQLLE